ncbi:MAG: hypothetical protein ACTSUE_00305 [Promethearchaeota archaeon]
MNVLLSIKPKYVNRIIDGTKKYEFRKAIFKQPDRVDRIYIYSSSPVKKIVGSFAIERILEDNPVNLWSKCWDDSGIEETKFFTYFEGKEKGFAIKIKDLDVFDVPVDPREIFDNFHAPQSFRYMKPVITQR